MTLSALRYQGLLLPTANCQLPLHGWLVQHHRKSAGSYVHCSTYLPTYLLPVWEFCLFGAVGLSWSGSEFFSNPLLWRSTKIPGILVLVYCFSPFLSPVYARLDTWLNTTIIPCSFKTLNFSRHISYTHTCHGISPASRPTPNPYPREHHPTYLPARPRGPTSMVRLTPRRGKRSVVDSPIGPLAAPTTLLAARIQSVPVQDIASCVTLLCCRPMIQGMAQHGTAQLLRHNGAFASSFPCTLHSPVLY